MPLPPRLLRCPAFPRCCSPKITPIATAWPNRPLLWWWVCRAAIATSVAPRVAALLDVMVMSDVTAVIDADTFERPIYAGNAVQTVKSGDAKKVFTVRTASFAAVAAGGAAAVGEIGGAGGRAPPVFRLGAKTGWPPRTARN